MTYPNSLVNLGALAGFSYLHKPVGVSGVMAQGIIPLHPSAHMMGTVPTFWGETPVMSLNLANKVPFAFYNGSGTGHTADIHVITAQKNMAALTGVAFELGLARITSLGPVTGAGGTLVTLAGVSPLNVLPNSMWMTSIPSTNFIGGVASLMSRMYHSEETNVAAQAQEAFPFWPPITEWSVRGAQSVSCPPGYGARLLVPASSVALYKFSLGIMVFPNSG